MMPRRVVVAAVLTVCAPQVAQACTGFVVDSAATLDGSAFAGMTADCSNCDQRLTHIAAASHPEGSQRPIYIFAGTAPRWVGYGRGSFYEPKNGEPVSKALGSIPQVSKTYAYWEATVPLMNEVGLSLGESSTNTRLINKPVGSEKEGEVGALLDITNIMQIVLERCATSRCAVELAGRLVEEYGYFPMVGESSGGMDPDGKGQAFGDGADALTLTDTTGDSWVWHVVGGVPGQKAKSEWVARRVPKGHVAFLPNVFTIQEIPDAPNDDYLFSTDIHTAAKAAGFWEPSVGPLNFAATFSPDVTRFERLPEGLPRPLYNSLRGSRLLSLIAPKAMENYIWDPAKLPFSLPAEKKLTRTDVRDLLRDVYNGTEFDMTKGALAGPFGNPFRIEGVPVGQHTQIARGISIQRTVYGFVGESRPGSKLSRGWYAPDAPLTSVFMPFYANTAGLANSMHDSLASGLNTKFSRDSAWWAFDFVANWMQLSFSHQKDHVFPKRDQLQAEMDTRCEEFEAINKDSPTSAFAGMQRDLQAKVVGAWWELADWLVMAFNDGFDNSVTPGTTFGYPNEFVEEVGMNMDTHPIRVRHAVDKDLKVAIPQTWSRTHKRWLYQQDSADDNIAVAAPRETVSAFSAPAVAAAVFTIIFTFYMGRQWEKRCRKHAEASVSSGYTVLLA